MLTRVAPPPRRAARSSPWPVFWVAVAAGWWLVLDAHGGGHVGQSGTFLPVVGVWALMAVAMMAPTAAPVLSALRDVLSGRSPQTWWTFLAAYLGVWLGFSVGAAALQVGLTNAGLLDHAGRTTDHAVAAVLLAGAGIYQFSAWKERCQTQCVRPLTFFVRFWREGTFGGVRMGFRHGLSCVGCCWMLMLLAFVGGVADVRIMALATVVMLIEKLPSIGRRISPVLGSALLLVAVVVLVVGESPDDGTPTEHDHPSQHTTSHATTSERESHEQLVLGG